MLVACGDDVPVEPADGEPTVRSETSADTLSDATAALEIGYEIAGNPIVGQPVGVNIRLSALPDDRPVMLNYRVAEVGSMTFPEAQAASIELLPLPGSDQRTQQVTVIPQREGRLFLLVSAQVRSDVAAVMKSASIPIQVSRAPLQGPENTASGDGEETAVQ